MDKVKVTFKIFAFDGEISDNKWVNTLQRRVISNTDFSEKTFEVKVEEISPLLANVCIGLTKKGVCHYVEVKYGNLTRWAFASNGVKDCWMHPLNGSEAADYLPDFLTFFK